MAVVGATQGLVAAFTFGIVVNAACAALFLYTKGHGSIFRDSQRLVLICFLLSSALWAQIGFVNVLLDISRSSMSCQIGIIFASVFDQLARFSIEQFLLWALNTGGPPSIWQMIPQFVVLGRFVAGAVFTGFTRPQTDTFCVATSSEFPIAVVVIVLDVVIMLLLASKAYSSAKEMTISDSELARRVSVKLILVGLAVWTATSVTLLLGIRSVAFAVRTAVPAAGLTVLILIVTGCAGTLNSPRGSSSRPPEAPSPRRITMSRDLSTSDSDYPPSRFEDLKDAAIRSSTAFVNPREAPTFKEEESGVFPFNNRVEAASTQAPPSAAGGGFGRARKVDNKGGMFNFGRSTNIQVNKVLISAPILQDNNDQNPLNKIPVIGLEEAAQAERLRRLKMQMDPMVPPAPAATQMMNPEEAMKRGVSVKRKEVVSMMSQASAPSTTLQPESTASTTASQLSPAIEELRRRSPRQQSPEISDQVSPLPQLADVDAEVMQPLRPPQMVRPPQPAKVSPGKPSPVKESPKSAVQQPIPRPDIRPSRQAPPTPKAASPEPAPTTALQKRPTIGLPTNPRARGMKVVQPAVGSQPQTVMFVNQITYNNPTTVKDVIDDAKTVAARNAAFDPRASVVNRPRPVPRRPDPPQPSPSPKHRRSRSGTSVGGKSILTSAPGSPSQLPPLPPPPMPATTIRPNPNDTKSMTVDEKMTMFFPSPPSGGKNKKAPSTVPQLPPIPVSYLNTSNSPTESRRSNRTTRTSFKTESILDVDEIPRKMPEQTSKFSPMTEMNLADEVGDSWIPGLDADNRSTGRSANVTKRASSPVIPPAMPARSSAWTEATEDDAITNWGTVHSPEVAIGVRVMQNAVQTSTIRKAPAPPIPENPPITSDNGGEDVTFMLDELQFDNRQSWFMDDAKKTPENERTTPSPNQWHRRVGDECPTFSAREKTRSRKMPPPTPLQLSGVVSRNKIIIQAEPSPLESPEHALQEIQAQLKKLDDSNRESMNSPSHRLALLEDLEREMGQQEDQWKEMKHDLRDSMASVQTTSPGHRISRLDNTTISKEPGTRTSIAQGRRNSRRAKMRNSGVKPADAVAWSPPAEGTNNNWQKRLTEAQSEYMEVAEGLLRTRNASYLTVSQPQHGAQLGSPTPPESDQSDVEVAPPVPVRASPPTQKAMRPRSMVSLWKPKQLAPPARRRLLWARIQKAAPAPEAPLPGLSIRPAQRKESAPLEIHSTALWRKPYSHVHHNAAGLWRPAWASAAPPANPSRVSSQVIPAVKSQKAPRPLTQRPPRRNKRMTLLPDIVESPQPLPDKRGTLGIYQFPWGEMSDTALIQNNRSTYMAMPGTMASGGPSAHLEQRSKQLESAEYSSSFFDDYDDDENSEDGDESDDGFDETTLWEIASLLKTDNVPSTRSMFPPAHPTSVVEEYMDDIPSDDDRRRSTDQSIVIGLADNREVLFEQPLQLNLKPTDSAKPKGRSQAIVVDDDGSTFRSLEDEFKAAPPVPSLKPTVYGLPSNPKASKIPRAAPQATTVAEPEPAPVPKLSQIPRLVDNKKAGKTKHSPLGMWTPPAKPTPSKDGLFTPDPNRTDYRTTSAEPAAQYIVRAPRPVEFKPLDKLASKSLWTKTDKTTSTGLWKMPAKSSAARRSGLFVPDPRRTDYRTTSAEPAAQYIVRAPRPVEFKPLDKLASKSLWAKADKTTSTGLWKMPVKSSAVRSGLFVPDPRRTDYRTTSAEPAAKEITRAPRPSEAEALDALTSTSLWAGSPTPMSLSDSLWIKPVTATPAAWEAALKDAIAASYRRRHITPEEWDAALQEAIHLSYPSLTSRPSLRRQRSQVSTRERPASRAASRTRGLGRSDSSTSSSGGGKRKDEIRAQIRALESQPGNDVPPSIMAQIEALEQERLFVQQAAQQEYARRTSVSYQPPVIPAVPEIETESVIPSAAEVVAQLQRRVSMARSRSTRVQAPSAKPTPTTTGSGRKPSMHLWTPPTTTSSQAAQKGLWTPNTPHIGSAVLEQDDAEALAQRARGRKARAKQARRAEILAQIAAIENDVDPMAAFRAQKMWRGKSRRNGARHWLHERKPSRGVMLRY
ncbi:hypothetical protein QBC39DRAFT_408782 [Podospora conica]|nr:hypothetical protein QBC39DRAFT_408782 [Schizothecium conicum]